MPFKRGARLPAFYISTEQGVKTFVDGLSVAGPSCRIFLNLTHLPATTAGPAIIGFIKVKTSMLMIRSQIMALSSTFLLLGLSACGDASPAAGPEEEAVAEPAPYAIVIHGGAGTIRRENMTAEQEEAYRNTLNEALDIGEAVLREGGGSLEAVTQTIEFMENSPLFNAGKGSVFTNAGRNELDASIMEGANRQAGAIGGVTTVKNPIKLARAVMEQSEHVLLMGEGAEQFAAEQGVERVDPEYFYTERRWKALQRAKAATEKGMGLRDLPASEHKFGTVGCVALDRQGTIVAGTSTGGMTNKRYHRIGDSPVIGAGTYADNATCGVSCTGHGEFFIRYVAAYDVAARMAYQELPVQEAADRVIHGKLKEAGGTGGLIALDRYGNVAMPFNTSGMYRGYAKPGERVVRIYQE